MTSLDKTKGVQNVDLSGIDKIYDDLDSQENKSVVLFYSQASLI